MMRIEGFVGYCFEAGQSDNWSRNREERIEDSVKVVDL